MSNEQRAHDLTLLYVELFANHPVPDKDGNFNVDPYSKYFEIYPAILKKVNQDFPNN